MKVEILTLCDFAQAEPTGKLNILGAFDHLFAREEPISRSLFAVAMRIRFELDEEGSKTLALSIVDSDGKRMQAVVKAQFPVKIQPTETSATVNLAMLVPQIKLPHFGDYQLDVMIDSKVEGAVPFYVRQRPSPPATT